MFIDRVYTNIRRCSTDLCKQQGLYILIVHPSRLDTLNLKRISPTFTQLPLRKCINKWIKYILIPLQVVGNANFSPELEDFSLTVNFY